jgi:hypothetical protein
MKTTPEGSRGHQKTPHYSGPREDDVWGRPAPPPYRLVPCGAYLSRASRIFLHRLPRLHLRRSLNQFDPRAHIAPPGLYIQACTPWKEAKSGS